LTVTMWPSGSTPMKSSGFACVDIPRTSGTIPEEVILCAKHLVAQRDQQSRRDVIT
jgi:hypothetical protein